jgi:hypothetical protein
VSSYWTDRALAFITSEPVAWLKLVGRKVLLLVNRGEMLDTESQASYAEWSWPLKATGWFAHFGVLVPLAVIGVWATWADRRRLAILCAHGRAASVVIFYVCAIPVPACSILFGVWGRMSARSPVMSSATEETNHGTPAPGREHASVLGLRQLFLALGPHPSASLR